MRYLFVLITLCIFSESGFSKAQDEKWIFTPVVGINKLSLKVFYDTVYNAPFVGTVQVTTDLPEDVQGESAYPSERFYFENNLQQRKVDVEAGLEMRRYFGKQNDFFIGIDAWETIAESDGGVVTFPLQGQAHNRAKYYRRGKLSYTEYYLGLRHYLTARSAKFNAYLNLSLREMYDIDYEESNVFEFISGAPKGFRRIFIFKSQATGLLMMQLGGGLEFDFTERFSIALEGAYALHIQDGALKGVRVNNDFNDGDRIDSEPFIIKPINALLEAGALDENGETYQKVQLRFDGWHALAKFNIVF